MVKVSKEKQSETLEKMVEVRQADTRYLRDLITQKRQWAVEEKQKGIDLVKKYEQEIEKLNTQILRLEGYIVATNDFLEPVEAKE